MWTETVPSGAAKRLVADWTALEATAARVPASISLLRAAGLLEHPGVRIIVVRDGQGLVGVWPLCVQRVGPALVAHRLGGELVPYDGLTLSDRACGRAVQQAACRELQQWRDVDVLRLDAVLAGEPLLSNPCIAPWSRPTHRTCRLLLDPERQLLSRRSKSRRKSVRRRRRALERKGPVRLVRSTTADARVDAVRTAILAKLAWLDSKGAPAPVMRSRVFQDRLVAVARQPVHESRLEVFALEVAGQGVAWELGYRDGDRYHSFIGAYDADYSELGVGVSLTLEVADWCARNEVRIYDFLPPLTDFKSDWADHERTVHEVVGPLRGRGRLFVPAVRDGRKLAKKAWQALIPLELAQVMFVS